MSIQANEEEITNRLDLTIMRDYKNNKNFMRATRDRFNQTWKTDSNISPAWFTNGLDVFRMVPAWFKYDSILI